LNPGGHLFIFLLFICCCFFIILHPRSRGMLKKTLKNLLLILRIWN